jgi:hypothetical protein
MASRRQQRTSHQIEFKGATMAQLRADIDSGRTGDKVAAVDHAAAPLGTDEEAAGTPVAADIVARAREYECNRNSSWEMTSAHQVMPHWTLPALGLIAGLVAVVTFAWSIN